MVLLKIVPIDRGKIYTHIYACEEHKAKYSVQVKKTMGPCSPPSLSLSPRGRVPRTQGQVTQAEQNATFSLGLPLPAPVDPGMGWPRGGHAHKRGEVPAIRAGNRAGHTRSQLPAPAACKAGAPNQELGFLYYSLKARSPHHLRYPLATGPLPLAPKPPK